MIIELVGLPACGKTTLVKSISHNQSFITMETLFGDETDNRLFRGLRKIFFLFKNFFRLN